MKLTFASLILLVMAAACTVSTTGTTLPEPTSPLGDEYTALVAFEARWKCDIQRYALDDLLTIGTELSKRLVDSGISADTYDRFKAMLDLDDDLRLHTRLAVREVCVDG